VCGNDDYHCNPNGHDGAKYDHPNHDCYENPSGFNDDIDDRESYDLDDGCTNRSTFVYR
jgi:hypothetical protein